MAEFIGTTVWSLPILFPFFISFSSLCVLWFSSRFRLAHLWQYLRKPSNTGGAPLLTYSLIRTSFTQCFDIRCAGETYELIIYEFSRFFVIVFILCTKFVITVGWKLCNRWLKRIETFVCVSFLSMIVQTFVTLSLIGFHCRLCFLKKIVSFYLFIYFSLHFILGVLRPKERKTKHYSIIQNGSKLWLVSLKPRQNSDTLYIAEVDLIKFREN